VLETIPVEKRLEGLHPEERVQGLSPEELAACLSEEGQTWRLGLAGRSRGMLPPSSHVLLSLNCSECRLTGTFWNVFLVAISCKGTRT